MVFGTLVVHQKDYGISEDLATRKYHYNTLDNYPSFLLFVTAVKISEGAKNNQKGPEILKSMEKKLGRRLI